VGVDSQGEYLDFEAIRPISPKPLRDQINQCLPRGLGLDQVAEVESGAQSLGDLINAASYSARLEAPISSAWLARDLAERLGGVTELKVTRERKGQQEEVDVLPSIHRIAAAEDGTLEMVLRVGGTGAARPDDVIRGLFGPAASARITRQDLLVLRDGEALSPMACRGLLRVPPAPAGA